MDRSGVRRDRSIRRRTRSGFAPAIISRVLTVLIGVGLEVVQNQEDKGDGEETADVPADKLTRRQIDQLKKRLDKGETIESMKEAVTGRPAGRSDLFIEPDGAITV